MSRPIGFYWKRHLRLAQTADGAGATYTLPAGMPLMDCAGCGRAVTRRQDLALLAGATVPALGGHLFDRHGHARPYCHPCYLRERGLI